MSCRELLESAAGHQHKTRLDCPIRIFPVCHPKAYVEVFVDGKQQIITLVCSACDTTMSVIRINKVKHEARRHKRPKT